MHVAQGQDVEKNNEHKIPYWVTFRGSSVESPNHNVGRDAKKKKKRVLNYSGNSTTASDTLELTFNTVCLLLSTALYSTLYLQRVGT